MVVKEFDSVTQLVAHVSDLFKWIRIVTVIFQKVENTDAQHLESDTHMAMIVEPVEHFHTEMSSTGIFRGQLFQNVDLQLGCFSVLFYIFDNLEGDDRITTIKNVMNE